MTKASDIYSLGVIAYRMLTNNLPFNARSHTHLYALQMEGVRVKPSGLCPNLSPEAEQVILTALSYDPGLRQQSAKEFGDQLYRALTEWPPSKASAPTPQPVVTAPVNGKPGGAFKKWLVAAAALVVVALIVSGLMWFWKSPGRGSARVQAVEKALENGDYDVEPSFPKGPPPPDAAYATIGFNVWRARPATAQDAGDAARDTVEAVETVSERVDVGGFISVGEKFKLGIESLTEDFLPDDSGYLYVISREQYADGSFGKACLLFPNVNTFNGDNTIRTEQPIDLPKQGHYRIERSAGRTDQVAETYTIIISPWKLWLPPLDPKGRTQLPPEMMAEWQQQFGERDDYASLRGGARKTRTRREQRVGARETVLADEPLTSNDPPPQTLLRAVVTKGAPAMVTVTLKVRG